MQFSVQLGPYLPATAHSGEELFYDYLDQAILCDRMGFNSVTLTEHHLLSVLLMPAPLQFAIRSRCSSGDKPIVRPAGQTTPVLGPSNVILIQFMDVASLHI